MNSKKIFKNKKINNLFTGISVLLIIGLLVALCVNVGKLNTSRKVTNLDYAITSISSTTGKDVDSNLHISMKNKKAVDGLSIKLSDNAQITYKVAFYDEDGAFVSMTTAQSADFDNSNIPSTAETFRVEITPNQVDGKDVTITIWNISNYTAQLTIVYNK